MSSKKPEAQPEPLACVITLPQTEILIGMLIPKAAFSSQRPPTGQQLSSSFHSFLLSLLIWTASARMGTRGSVSSVGNLQSQGPASLNPAGGAEKTEEQASFSPRETKGLVRNQTRSAVNTSALAPARNNHESPDSEQMGTHLWLHLGAALKNHLEVPESQIIIMKLFPKLVS